MWLIGRDKISGLKWRFLQYPRGRMKYGILLRFVRDKNKLAQSTAISGTETLMLYRTIGKAVEERWSVRAPPAAG